MIRDVATPLLSVAAPGGLPITPCIEVRSQSGESDCSGIATREYRAFRNAAIPFSGGGSSEQESDGRSRPYRCHHPRKRMIEYSTERSFKPRGRGVLDTRLRGYDSRLLIALTQARFYSDSGSVAASSHTLMASTTTGRTRWRAPP